MQVEFISNKVDVMTHDCLSSVALALHSLTPEKVGLPRSELPRSRSVMTIRYNGSAVTHTFVLIDFSYFQLS